MAFSSAITEKFILDGKLAIEKGTWNGSGVTTGTITVDTATAPKCGDVVFFSLSSDGDTAVIGAEDVAPNKLKLTFSSGDTGKYMIACKLVG